MPLLMLNKRGVQANSWLLLISQKKEKFLMFFWLYYIVKIKVGQPNLLTELYYKETIA